MSEHVADISRERESGCIFCEVLLEQVNGLVIDTAYWRILVSRDQGYLGRCMVIPIRHIEREADLSEAEVLNFHYVKAGLEEAVSRAFGARMCNWTELGNDAFQDAEPKPHLHHHMRPRYENPVEFASRQFDDHKWAHMYDSAQRWNVDKDPNALGFKDLVATAIRENLELLLD